ncbi:MAG: hypothetical protein WCL21_15690 [Mariniphaga sp.]
MKTKSRLFTRAKGFAPFLFLIIVLFTKPHAAAAQKVADSSKLLKYELSIDLVPLIDNGQFGKIYFKIKHFKDKKLKGALRIGASRGNYSWLKTVPYNGSNPSFDTHYSYDFSVFVGYEKRQKIAFAIAYYGVDIQGFFNKSKYDTYAQGNNFSNTQFGICPFVGLRQPIYKNLSIAIELGWQGWFGYSKTFEESGDYIDAWIFSSGIGLPYNFTLNYNF